MSVEEAQLLRDLCGSLTTSAVSDAITRAYPGVRERMDKRRLIGLTSAISATLQSTGVVRGI